MLVRLRADRCFYADPPPRATRPKRPAAPPRRQVRLRRPGHLAGPDRHPCGHDDQYGTVTVQAWSGLHPKQHRHPGHGTGGPRPIVRGTIIRVQVERVPARTRPPKVLWLWWAGPGELDLDLAWRAYVRRFDLEHTVRFCQADPRLDHPAAARTPPRPTGGPGWCWPPTPNCAWPAARRRDQRLPWERPRPQPRLSPLRVRRGFPRLLVRLGSPAAAPKPAGRSPGRPKGRASGPAARYPAIKKPTKRPRNRPTHGREGRLTGPQHHPHARRPGQQPAQHAHRVKSQA